MGATHEGQFFEWLLSVPWWAIWGFALVSTFWLIWVSWPRQCRDFVNQSSEVSKEHDEAMRMQSVAIGFRLALEAVKTEGEGFPRDEVILAYTKYVYKVATVREW